MAITEKPTVQVTTEELTKLLMEFKGHTFVNIISETVPSLIGGKKCPYHGIVKVNKRNYSLGTDYKSRIENNMKKEGLEGNVEIGVNKIGVHVSQVVLYNENTDCHYLAVEPYDEIGPIQTEYYLDGNPIDKVLLNDYIRKSTKPTTQPQDKGVRYTAFKIQNIKQISLKGTIYQVVNN